MQHSIPALQCRNLRKVYPGVVALHEVSLTVGAGELHALVGENGAGKSTLVKIIAGQTAPDEGEVLIGGAPVHHFSPQEARARGVTMVPQHPDLFHSLSALENLFVGTWPRGPLGAVSWGEMRRRAKEVLDEMGVSLDLKAPAGELSVAERQMLQIARSLLAEARLFIFDEPTAPLGRQETERLFALIRRLHAQGVAMIYISHRLAEVFELAQQVTVLRDGHLVATLPIREVTREGLIGMMVGVDRSAGTRLTHRLATQATSQRQSEASTAAAAPLLQASGLTSPGKFQDANIAVVAGEIVGLAGVAGSGRNELLRALAGAQPFAQGALHVAGQRVHAPTPRLMRDLGVSFVPADRHHEALILPMSARENITLGCLQRFTNWAGLLRRKAEASSAQQLAARLDVRAANLNQPLSTLSGGNQQKVALASRLATQPRVLLLEEPTQGVDVGARAEIHRHMQNLAAQGVAIILVSSDLPELLTLSHRVLVMHRGRMAGELPREHATQERVLELALGASVPPHTPAAPEDAAGAGSLWHESPKERTPPLQLRRGRLSRELGLAALLVLYALVVSLRAPTFATIQNLTDIFADSSYMLIAACGMTLVVLTAGIDISIGSVLAVCATVAAAAAAAGWPVAVILGVALAAGLTLGAINGGLIAGLRIPPIIATLATYTLFRHLLIHISGGRWISLPPGFRQFGNATPLGVPLAVWIAALTAILVGLGARWAPLGRACYAAGSNPEAAEHLGISIRRLQLTVYAAMGLLVGLAAFVYVMRWTAVQTNAGLGFEMVVITAVVVGGTNIFGGSGTIGGTVIGVLLLGTIGASLTPLRIEPSWEKTFQGGLVLLAVVVDTLRTRRRAT